VKEIKAGLKLKRGDLIVSEAVQKDVQDSIKSFLDSAVNYLNCNTIVDDFSDHTKRREWRHTMFLKNPDLYEVYSKNRLSLNSISTLLTYFQAYILPLCQGKLNNPTLEKHLIELVSRISEMIYGKDYDDYNIEQKLSITEDIAEACRTTINLFIENNLVQGESV
jgi:hypothetical protein